MITYEWVAYAIRQFAEAINGSFDALLKLLSTSNWFDEIFKSPELSNIIAVIKAISITLCALFFLIDFFSKTLHLQWVTWENVLMLCVKVVLAKVLVDNADYVVKMIYTGFSSIVRSVDPGGVKLIPTGNIVDTAQFFWLNASEAGKLSPPQDPGFFNFEPMMMAMRVNIVAMIMQLLMIICNVIVIARIFELVIYTIVAPVPLATFACDGLTDIGKSFLKSYAAVTIQAIVLMIMFMAYVQIQGFMVGDFIDSNSPIYGWLGLIQVFTLALGVMQSGSWAKRICGAL